MSSPTSPLSTKAIRAGAGAGKTYTLTRDVIAFALQFREHKGRWPRFIVTTFTRKATQELQERLLTLALSEFPQALDFVSSSSHLKISTIHGVLDELLKEHGHWIGLKSDFGYLRETEALFLSKKSLKEVYEHDSSEFADLMQVFSFAQIHQLLRASSEKDMSELKPISLHDNLQLLQSHLDQLAERCQSVAQQARRLDLPGKWPAMITVLESLNKSLNIEVWRNPENALQTISDFNLRGGLKSKDRPEGDALYEDFKELVEDLRKLKEPAYQVKTIENLHVYNQQFAVLQKHYLQNLNDKKRQTSRIEIKDLELYSAQLVREHTEQLRSWVEKRDYWFIDEFQDTSPQQMTLLQELIGANPYYLVGDPQQSIYLFRGARSEVFTEQFDKVLKKGGSTHFLEHNYRSTPSLLAFINTSAGYLGENFSEMKAARLDLASEEIDVSYFVATGEEKDQIEQQESHFIYHTICALQGQGVSLDTIAILVRKNKQLESVGQFLSQLGVPVHLHSSGQFWRRREVLGCIQLLKFLLLPEDDENLLHLLRIPTMSVSDQQLVDLQNKKEKSLWAEMREGCASGHYGLSGKSLVDLQKNKKLFGVVLAFEKALLDLGFFTFHKHQDPTGRSEGNLWKFVSLLKMFERERGANMVQFLLDCEKARWTESSVDSPGSVEKNKVNIMTVHASKGLQFGHVILPFLSQKPNVDRHIPLAIDETHKNWALRSPANETEMGTTSSLFEKKVLAERKERQQQEDLRVLYVALTRAEKSLHLSWAQEIPKESWAAQLLFLPELTQTSTSFRVKEIHQAELLPLTHFKTERPGKTTVVPAWSQVDDTWSMATSQAVTKIIQRGQKSYRDSHIKKQQGILFHKLVEILKYPVPKDLPSLLQTWFGEESQEDVLTALNYILALNEPPLAELMKIGHVEWAFRWKNAEQTIDGQVDLWGISEGVLWVVDYKSGERILLDKAFSQLEIYCQAIQRHLKWTGPVRRAVIYPFLQTTVVRDWNGV